MIRLKKTQSICPVCLKPVNATYIMDKGKVIIEKACAEHGKFTAKVSENPLDYIKWTDHVVLNVPPKQPLTKGALNECPLHCGTCENHLQTACCVLIDVTQRCNQHCAYCFAEANGKGGDIPLDEIDRKFSYLLSIGEERPFNIQLSGGEPTVRDDLPEIIRMGREKGFEYMQINTNGRRIAEEKGYALKLKEAGATVIYLQFDGTSDDIYMKLRNEPLFEKKKMAIAECRAAGLPVVLVPTVLKDVNFDNIGKMMEFLIANRDVVKGIHFQPAAFFGRYPEDGEKNRVTMFDCMHAIEEQTGGMFKYDDLCTISTGHTLCCFYGTYTMEGNKVKSMLSENTRQSGLSCCETEDPLDIVKRDRDFVLNKWKMYEESESLQEYNEDDVIDLDAFLNMYIKNMFTVSGMAFMDKMTMDADRLKRCRVLQLTDDDRLIPFCAYNGIYRKEGKK